MREEQGGRGVGGLIIEPSELKYKFTLFDIHFIFWKFNYLSDLTTWPRAENGEQGNDGALNPALLRLAEAAVDVVQLCERCDHGGEVETGEQSGAGQVVQAQQATHHRLGDPRHLEAVQQGGGDNPGTTWVDNTVLP